MTQSEFIELVAQMRTAQKTYFITRDKGVLEQSKSLERQVDAAIAMSKVTTEDIAEIFKMHSAVYP